MEIVNKSGEFNARQAFRMLNGKSPKISKSVGVTFNCVGFVETKPDETDDEKAVPVLYLLADDGEIYATTSNTVRRTFNAMRMSFGDPTKENPIYGILIVDGESRNGRKFIDLDILD